MTFQKSNFKQMLSTDKTPLHMCALSGSKIIEKKVGSEI